MQEGGTNLLTLKATQPPTVPKVAYPTACCASGVLGKVEVYRS